MQCGIRATPPRGASLLSQPAVVSLTPGPNGTVVRFEILPGGPLEYAEALARARLLSA
jgi:hypothetical protein